MTSYSASWMEPPKASAIPKSHGFIKDFRPKVFTPPGRQQQSCFQTAAWGEDLNYLRKHRQKHRPATHSPANKTQQEGRVSTASKPITGVRAGLPRVKEQPHFSKELLGPSCHPGDSTLDQVVVSSPGLLHTHPPSPPLRVPKSEICSEKISHFNKNTRGGERGLQTST